jgi:putative heme iron utilization protein
MDRAALDSVRVLLQTTRVLSLAFVADGSPEAALLPFALREDFGAVYVQASSLARHAAALQPGARVGVLVHANDARDADPMQLPRLSVAATVSVLDKDTQTFRDAAARLIERFPAARMTLAFADFDLYELTLGDGRYVEGFARAFDVSSETFAAIAAL